MSDSNYIIHSSLLPTGGRGPQLGWHAVVDRKSTGAYPSERAAQSALQQILRARREAEDIPTEWAPDNDHVDCDGPGDGPPAAGFERQTYLLSIGHGGPNGERPHPELYGNAVRSWLMVIQPLSALDPHLEVHTHATGRGQYEGTSEPCSTWVFTCATAKVGALLNLLRDYCRRYKQREVFLAPVGIPLNTRV